METRSIRTIESINVEHAMTGFYVLEELHIMASRMGVYKTLEDNFAFRYLPNGNLKPNWEIDSARRAELWAWKAELGRVRAAYHEDLAARIHDYIVLIAFGEARHAPACINMVIPEINGITTRSTVSAIATNFDPLFALESLKELFMAKKWGHAYGGESWARICDAGLMYYTDPPTPLPVIIDHVADLSHNGNICFDKGVLFQLDNYGYKNMLDRKCDGSLLDGDCGLFLPSPIGALTLSAPEPLYTALEKRIKDRVIGTPSISYTPIQFRNARLSPAIPYEERRREPRRRRGNGTVYYDPSIIFNPRCYCSSCYGYSKLTNGMSWRNVCKCALCAAGHKNPTVKSEDLIICDDLILDPPTPTCKANSQVNPFAQGNPAAVQTAKGIWKPKKTCKCKACKFYKKYGVPSNWTAKGWGIGDHKWGWDAGKMLDVDKTLKMPGGEHDSIPW